MIQDIPSRMIRADSRCQPRAELSSVVINEYAEVIDSGALLPPLDVFDDEGRYWLADGFHRLGAYRKRHHDTIRCNVRSGGLRDAIYHAAAANQLHGLRRSNEDKRKAVQMMLVDADWAKWSDWQLAKHCGVSNTFVGAVRKEFKPAHLSTLIDGEENEIRELERVVKRGDTQYKMNTAGIGKRAEPTAEEEVREEFLAIALIVANLAGIANPVELVAACNDRGELDAFVNDCGGAHAAIEGLINAAIDAGTEGLINAAVGDAGAG